MPRKAKLEEIAQSPEFKWVKVAASKDDYRIVLHSVLVERGRLVAADGFRLRVWDVRTDVKKSQLCALDGTLQVTESTFPDYERLWDDSKMVFTVVIDAVKLRVAVNELTKFAAAHRKTLESKERRDLLVVVKFVAESGRLYLRRQVKSAWDDKSPLELPAIFIARAPRLQVVVQECFMKDAVKDLVGDVRIDLCSGGGPVRISDGHPRYELIMPMYVGNAFKPRRSYEEIAVAALKKNVGVTPGRLRAMRRATDQPSSNQAYALAASLALHPDGSRIVGRAQRFLKKMDRWFKEERER